MDNSHNPKSGSSAPRAGGDSLFHLLAANEGMWGPYRSVFNALLQVQRDRAAALNVQRDLAIELAELMKREQDMVMQLSASALDAGARQAAARLLPSDKVFDAAIACVRELGLAAVNLHIGALEALRTQQHAAADTPKPAPKQERKPAPKSPPEEAPEITPASVEPITGAAIAPIVPTPFSPPLHDLSPALTQPRRSFHGEEIEQSRLSN